MKVIIIYFEDDDFNKPKEAKGKLGWREFILTLIKIKNSEKTKESD